MRRGRFAPVSLDIARLVLGWQVPGQDEGVAAGSILV
jgi:hypothetical protein